MSEKRLYRFFVSGYNWLRFLPDWNLVVCLATHVPTKCTGILVAARVFNKVWEMEEISVSLIAVFANTLFDVSVSFWDG